MAQEPHVLPLVQRIRVDIDAVFVRYVGPIAAELCQEEFGHWCAEGHTGPSSLHRYITRLARYVTEDGARRAFIGDASKCIHVQKSPKS